MKEIMLTKGRKAIIDDEDFEKLSHYKWCVDIKRLGIQEYALTANWINGKSNNIMMHRLIMNLKKLDKRFIDHINGNGLDNRKINLRICTRSQNQWNSKKHKKCISKYKGVSWDKTRNRWQCHIKFHYISINLGRYKSETDAAIAYNNAALKYHGDFARLNELSET